jgi:hypothetical protein
LREEFAQSKCSYISEDTACKSITKCNKAKKTFKNIYSKLEANGRTKLKGHNPHFRLEGNRNELEKRLREEKRQRK